MLQPLKPVSNRAKLVLGAAFFVLFFAAWAAVTYGGVIDAMFLKTPLATLATGYGLFTEFGLTGEAVAQAAKDSIAAADATT